jgi:type I restriction enzyme S subunit
MSEVTSRSASGNSAGGHLSRWKLYPAYRDSGVEWLGEVPEHWESKRLKYVASINDDALPESTPPGFGIAYVDISSVEASAGIVAVEEMVFEDAPSRARRVVRDGDTIISTVRTYLRAIAPILALRSNLVVSTGFAVVRPRSVAPGFLSYALRESRFVESIVARSVGVSYPAVNASDVGTISIPLPTASEQHAIAAFLDRETEKLDTLVEKKRALIGLLKEKRSALISRTVTRGLPPDAARAAGLDPHPKLTPSGIEWIGEVPEHWDVKRLKFVARLQTGPFGSQLHASDYVAGGAPIVNPSHLSNGCISPDPDITADEDTRMRLSRHVLAEGDIVLARRGEMGRCALVTEREGGWLCGSGSMRIRVEGHAMHPPLLAWALSTRGIQESLLLSSVGTTMDNLNREIVGDVSIPIPEIPEQRVIADYLDREAGRLDQMAARVEEAVERLQEYRAALITAAVTGKIDVRGADVGASF